MQGLQGAETRMAVPRFPSLLPWLALMLYVSGASSRRPSINTYGLLTPDNGARVEGGDENSGHRDGARGPSRRTAAAESQGGETGTLCAYQVLGDGEDGRLCFRYAQPDFQCARGTCRRVSSPSGHLVANLLSNGSVLLQWTYPVGEKGKVSSKFGGETRNADNMEETEKEDVTKESHVLPKRGSKSGHPEGQEGIKGGYQEQDKGVKNGHQKPQEGVRSGYQEPQGGFRMSCWWNGSYTQFECPGVHLASGCRDYLLTSLHENVPYRICLQPLSPSADWDASRSCLDFSVAPSGMQDIVIAMTTVGGTICVMLVIICLLVAYITENIMSSSVQRTLTAQHSRRSHNTHL